MSTQKIQSVLYVDDDPDMRAVVQAALCSIAGLAVHIAGSGEQAIDLAYECRPDLIVMDVMMPGLDGPSTFKSVRERALLADIPVIFLTAKTLPAEAGRLLQLGAIGVIGKPFDPLKLYDNLSVLWKNAGAARAIRGTGAGQPRVRAQVSSLADSFLKRTRNDVIRLRAFIERARHGDRSALAEAERTGHSIHGAGEMFGFPEIGAAGGAIERLAAGVMSGTTPPSSTGEPAELQQLSDFTEQLVQALEAAGRTSPRNAGMFQGRRGCRIRPL
jgi:two-component system OmpR family response regulator